MKRALLFAAILATLLVLAGGAFLGSTFRRVPKLFRRNAELKAQGYDVERVRVQDAGRRIPDEPGGMARGPPDLAPHRPGDDGPGAPPQAARGRIAHRAPGLPGRTPGPGDGGVHGSRLPILHLLRAHAQRRRASPGGGRARWCPPAARPSPPLPGPRPRAQGPGSLPGLPPLPAPLVRAVPRTRPLRPRRLRAGLLRRARGRRRPPFLPGLAGRAPPVVLRDAGPGDGLLGRAPGRRPPLDAEAGPQRHLPHPAPGPGSPGSGPQPGVSAAPRRAPWPRGCWPGSLRHCPPTRWASTTGA